MSSAASDKNEGRNARASSGRYFSKRLRHGTLTDLLAFVKEIAQEIAPCSCGGIVLS
jgi:hypothetical protein